MTQADNGFDVELASCGHSPPVLLYADGSAYYVDKPLAATLSA